MKKLSISLFAAALIPTISWSATCSKMQGQYACKNTDTNEEFVLEVSRSEAGGFQAFKFESTPLMMDVITDSQTHVTNNWDDEIHQSVCRWDGALIVRQQFKATQTEVWKKTTVKKSSSDLIIKQRVDSRWNGVDLETLYQSWDCSAI